MRAALVVAIMALGLYGLTAGDVNAHHNTQHSLGPCGTVPCPNGGK